MTGVPGKCTPSIPNPLSVHGSAPSSTPSFTPSVVQYNFVDGRWRPVQNRKVDGVGSILSTAPTVLSDSSISTTRTSRPTGRASELLLEQIRGALQHQLGPLRPSRGPPGSSEQSTGTLPNVDSVRLGTPNKSASG